MHLPPFLLDRWLAAHEFAAPPIRYNLAASTGPAWTLAELMALGSSDVRKQLDQIRVSYVPPEGTKALRDAIAEAHDVDPDWVVVTTGASEALSMLYCLAAEPGVSIVLPHPSFPAFAVMARAWGLEVMTYALQRENGFAQTADLVMAAVNEKTRLVLVNSPHNPTGSLMPPVEIARLSSSLAERGIPLIVDEVYHPLYFGAPAVSSAKLPNSIVVGDFSKALSLSGLRMGWLIDRDAGRREHLINLRSYFTVSGSPLTECVAVHALAHRDEILARLEDIARANLARLDEFMNAHRNTIRWVRPAGGTVAFPWRLDGRAARPMCEALAREGVLVAPGDCFEAPAHFRVGFGAQVSGFQEALDIVARVPALTEPLMAKRSRPADKQMA
jgi:aspartate/methionine/tyrosine aminotransferase